MGTGGRSALQCHSFCCLLSQARWLLLHTDASPNLTQTAHPEAICALQTPPDSKGTAVLRIAQLCTIYIFFFFFLQQLSPAMVTGFPGKSDCCIFPAVREQQVSGSLTPSPEPLGPSPSLDVEMGFSSSNTRKAIVHCQATAASQQDTAVTRGVPEDSPNSPPGARVGLMGLFHPMFLGTKPN